LTTHRVGLIGFGKIARERHAPAIAGDPRFELSCVADINGAALAGVPKYRDHEALLAGAAVDVVAICTPPAARFAIACDALKAGKHLLLEKPPTATVGELEQNPITPAHIRRL
jgi:D-galactose 1-dehydrogenase